MRRKKVLSSNRVAKIKKKKRRAWRKKFYLFVVILLVLLVSLSLLSQVKEINISQIEVLGNKIVDSKDIREFTQDKISGKYLWVIPKSNFAFYPKKKIKQGLLVKHPRLEEINLEVEDQTLKISVAERDTYYTWCGENIPLADTRPEEIKCYFTDENGFIFDEAPYFSGDVYFRLYGKPENSGLSTDPTGLYFIENGFSKFLDFKEIVEGFGLEPSSFFKNESGILELYLSSTKFPSEAPKIIFPENADFIDLAENLQAAVGVDPLRSNLEERYEDLQYIDLRFENKVYYKFQE